MRNMDELRAVAERLDGLAYGLDVESIVDCDELLREGMVIAYGESDDLLELRGAYDGEFQAYEGAELMWGRGVFFSRTVVDEFNEISVKWGCRKYDFTPHIRAVWAPEGHPLEPSWVVTPAEGIPFASFNIVEDDNVFCIGCVFCLEEIKIKAHGEEGIGL